MSTTLDQARTAYLDAVRARLDADAAVVAAAVECRRVKADPDDLPYAADDAWGASLRARTAAQLAEQRAHVAYEHELYAATYGHGGRP
jgi:hypothetical protein